MRRIVFALTIVAGVLAVALGASLAVAPSAAQTTTAEVRVTGCVVRLYDTGPEIHQDAWHDCTGADAVSINASGDLLIESSHSTPVISVTAALDETLARRGVLAGATQGVATTIVRFFDTGTGLAVDADDPAVTGAWSNVWMTWVHQAPEPEPSC